MQDLKKIQENCANSLRLLKNNEIDLSTEAYDASKSRVKITLTPVNVDIWKSYGDNPVVCCYCWLVRASLFIDLGFP